MIQAEANRALQLEVALNDDIRVAPPRRPGLAVAVAQHRDVPLLSDREGSNGLIAGSGTIDGPLDCHDAL